jgi:hypothetical protein
LAVELARLRGRNIPVFGYVRSFHAPQLDAAGEVTMVLATAGLLLTLAVAPADVTGKWDGTLTGQREDGSKNEDTALMILEQKDTTITGTVGGSETDQHPITSGKIDGNKITLEAKTASGREFHIELTLENDELKGTIVTGARRAELQLRKRKE